MRFRPTFQIFVLFFASTFASWAQPAPGEFTVVTLPDTQNYSEYYPQMLTSQTQWIAANAKALNIQFVIGLGDIVNDGSNVAQYTNADASYRVLDNAKIPYLAAIGNHDYKSATPLTRDATVFNSFFGPARYAGKSYYSGSFPQGSNENFYGVFNVNGTPYLVLALEFIPRDSAIQWASSIISQNPDKRVIIVTHAFLTPSALRQGHCDGNSAEYFGLAGDNDAEALWDKLVRKYSNITMVLNGHDTGSARRQDLGDNGNLVNQILSDYQDWADGGGAYLRIMTFKPSLNRIDITTYSPYYNQYLTDAGNQFSLNLAGTATSSPTGSIAGIVRNQATCAPIGGVTVTAHGGQGTSNSSGYYQTASAPAFAQSATASAGGWSADTQLVKVDAGYSAQLNYFMMPAGSATGSISIKSPASGANVVSPVQVSATGTTSAGAMTAMQLYDSGSLIYSAAGSSINAPVNLALGGHELVIQGSDAHGNIFKNMVNVVVQQSGSVTMTSPLNNESLASPVPVTGSAASPKAITALQVYEDNKLVYQVAAGSINTSLAMAHGTHYIVLQAWDAAGNVFKSAANITVTAPASAVNVVSPVQGAAVSSPVNVVATSVMPAPVTAMQIYQDNNLVYQVAAASLNTTLTMPAGPHTVAVKAWDATGNSSVTLRTITIH